MATYTIIGGDQKEYGSVTAEDMRKWIADGRLNAQSLAREERDTEWRALSTFPEFADALSAGSAHPPTIRSPVTTTNGGRDAALQLVNGPAVGLKVTAILKGVLALWSMVKLIFFPRIWSKPMLACRNSMIPKSKNCFTCSTVRSASPGNLFGLAMSVLVLIGAAKLQSLKSREFAFAAAILAMIPCLTPCCILGLPFGIWALVVLNKPEVKSQFG